MSGSILDISTYDVVRNLNTGSLSNLLASPLDRVFNAGGSQRAPFCFDESTEILCLNENLEEVYIPISQLTKGSIVKSFRHGYRKIDHIHKGTLLNNVNDFRSCMFVLPKNETMTKDLIITGGHSILVDTMSEKENAKNLEYFGGNKLVIDGKHLLLAGASSKFTPLQDTNLHTYYHFILENEGDDDVRYGVWANGILTETPSKSLFLNEILFLETELINNNQVKEENNSQFIVYELNKNIII
jgi:hypothetical protein